MAAHRYWDILVIGNSSNVASISRLEFRESIGGADTAAGNTAISTGGWSSPSNAFDGNDGTFTFSGSTSRSAPYSLGVDYGASSGGWKDIVEFAVRNRSDLAAQGPTNMVLRYSDDNITFVPVFQCVDDDWSAFSTLRTYALVDYPYDRVVLDVASPPTDAGPHAITLTPSGNATVSGGRFVFDGTGDYYSNTSIPGDIHELPYLATVEIGALLATNSGFNGILNIGDSSTRFLIVETDGSLQVWEDSTNRIDIAGVVTDTTPIDVKVQIEGTVVRCYVDGALLDTGVFSRGHWPDDIYLGTDPADLSGRSTLGGFASLKISHGLIANPASETVGTAAGTSTALGVSGDAGETAGHATGTGTASGHQASLGTIAAAGSAFGAGLATGVVDPFRRVVGSAAGTSNALGSGAAVGTISTVGTAAGISSSGSGSAATGVMSVVGNTIASGIVTGVGTARLEGAGSSVGTSTADAGGSYVPSATVGRSTGISVALAIGRGIRSLAGLALGTSEVLGKMSSVRATAGAAVGQGSAQGASNQNIPSVGAADATSAAVAVATGLWKSVGASDATSATAAVSVAFSSARGSSVGGSTVLGVSVTLAARAGLASGTSLVLGIAGGIASGVGTVTGTSTAVGASRELHLMRGSSSGASAADGHIAASSLTIGRAEGFSLVLGVGAHTAPDLDPDDIVRVEADDWLVIPESPEDTLVVVAVDDAIVVVPFDSSVALAA